MGVPDSLLSKLQPWPNNTATISWWYGSCRGHVGLAATDVAKLLEAVEEAGHVGARIYTVGNHLAGERVLATRGCSPQTQEKKETYGDHG